MHDDVILAKLEKRMEKLGSLVWKIPDIARAGMSLHKIAGAKSVLSVFSCAPDTQEEWIELARTLFTSFTGGRQEYWNDFHFVFWKWLEWVFDEENLSEDNRPESPKLQKPSWWDWSSGDIQPGVAASFKSEEMIYSKQSLNYRAEVNSERIL